MSGPLAPRVHLLLLRRPSAFLRLSHLSYPRPICTSCSRRITSLLPKRPFQLPRQHYSTHPQPGDNPAFKSLLDQPARLVRTHRRHRPLGLVILALIPLTAFALGTWQIFRLEWKTALVARCEDRISRDPLPLPPTLDISALPDFDYRRVVARGVFLHDKEILIGPRLHDGNNGYIVITPLDRSLDHASTILVNRGWINKDLANQKRRYRAGGERALPKHEVLVEGLLREPPKKNTFTPDNKPESGQWYFPDVKEMAEWTGAQEALVEETMSRILNLESILPTITLVEAT
ncbi:hypothetical protein ABW20_dc0108243 [Dactylellina cionopaga]|nr:hypothetical protein ABW20_dc0108243 [Dactylellina cionopaga]